MEKGSFLSYPNLITFVRLRLAQLKNSQPNLVDMLIASASGILGGEQS